MMYFWNWLKKIVGRAGHVSARPEIESYEQTLQVNQEITHLIHQIAEYEQRPREEVEHEILSHTREVYEHFEDTRAKWQSLSMREQDVTALTCLGYTNEDIARTLIISPNTVKAHLRNIQNKFNVRSKAQLRELFRGWDFSAFEHQR
jgi:DNA-binding CsgD family transcriptional regulator